MFRALLAVIGLVLLLLGAVLAVDGCSSDSDRQKNAPEPEATTEIIVARLQEIRQLASLRISASGIVHGSQRGRRFYQGTSRMVLLVRGEAIYSVDLTDVFIQFDAHHLEITLPPPEITATWVDVERSRIWSRTRGWFREDHPEKLERACWAAARDLVYQSANRPEHAKTASMSIEALIARIVHDIDPAIQTRIQWREQDGRG